MEQPSGEDFRIGADDDKRQQHPTGAWGKWVIEREEARIHRENLVVEKAEADLKATKGGLKIKEVYLRCLKEKSRF